MMIFWILLFLLGFSFPPDSHAAGDALAEVDGVAITSEEVEKTLAGQLSKLEEQIYNLKRQKLDALINDKLLEKEAAKRKLTVSGFTGCGDHLESRPGHGTGDRKILSGKESAD